MARRLPFPRLAPEFWPPALKAAWEGAIERERWSTGFVRQMRRAVANYLGFSVDRSLLEDDKARISAYAEMLLAHLAPSSAVTYIEHLMYGLQALAPEREWAWLVTFCRELRDLHLPRERTPRTYIRRRKFSLAVCDWPEELQKRWLATRQPREKRRYRDREKTIGPAAHKWSDAYAARVERGFGMYLSLAEAEGFGSEPSPEGIDRFCEITAERVAPVSLASYVWEIYQAAVIIFPHLEWWWLLGDAEFLKSTAIPSRNKVEQLAQISELRNLGHRLLREAEARTPRVASALDHRDALILTLLTYKPARVRNYAEAEYGEHVVVTEAGGRLDFPHTKNGDPDSHPLPADVARHVLCHWHRFRPMLKGASACQSLFLSKMGRPLSAAAISQIIGDLTSKKLSKRVPPHRFRDAVATSIAEYGPEFVESASVLLGQRDRRSIIVYSQYAQTTIAARRLEALTERYRKLRP
jgi:hypothetical protein